MNVMTVLAHPDPDSYCAALYESMVEGVATAATELRSHQLYEEQFDPRMVLTELRRQIPIDQPAGRYVSEIQDSDILFAVFPDWWGAEPAIFKGFLDRLLRRDIAYARGGSSTHSRNPASDGLLTRLHAHFLITSDTTPERRDSLLEMYKSRYRDTIGTFCGFSAVDVRLFSPVRQASLRTRKQWLQEARELGAAAVSKSTA